MLSFLFFFFCVVAQRGHMEGKGEPLEVIDPHFHFWDVDSELAGHKRTTLGTSSP